MCTHLHVLGLLVLTRLCAYHPRLVGKSLFIRNKAAGEYSAGSQAHERGQAWQGDQFGERGIQLPETLSLFKNGCGNVVGGLSKIKTYIAKRASSSFGHFSSQFSWYFSCV